MPTAKANMTTVNYTPRGTDPSWIVIHNTSNGTAKPPIAYNNTQYFKSEYRGASATYFIDDGDTVWQCVSERDTAWHCGEAASRNGCYNSNSIGIEVCEQADGTFTANEINTLRWLVQDIMKRYNIPASRVCRHHDVTGKSCPWYYSNDARWAELKAKILGSEDYSWPVQMYQSNGTAAQKWKLTKDKDGYFTIASTVNGKCLDVKGAGKTSGTTVQVYKPNGSDAQKWKLIRCTKTKEGYTYDPAELAPYEIEPKCAPGLRLDVAGGSSSDGAKVSVYTRNQTNAQLWYLIDNADGTFSLMGDLKGAKRFLDLKNGGK